jgi:hypothetical protein
MLIDYEHENGAVLTDFDTCTVEMEDAEDADFDTRTVETEDADFDSAVETEEDESTPQPRKQRNHYGHRRMVEPLTDDDQDRDKFQTPLALKRRSQAVLESEDMEQHYSKHEGRRNKPEQKEAAKRKRDQLGEATGGEKKVRKGKQVNMVGVKLNISPISYPLFYLERSDYQPSGNVRCDAGGSRLITNFELHWQCALFVSPYYWNFGTW